MVERKKEKKKAGVGGRIRTRLLELGYRKPDGTPDVQRFSWDFRMNPNHVHQWLSDTMTPFKHIVPLCQALDCSIEWLLTGSERTTRHQPPGGIMSTRKPLGRSAPRPQEFAQAV